MSILAVATSHSGTVDPKGGAAGAHRSEAAPQSATVFTHSAPVLGGVDFVDLANNKTRGGGRRSATLNGYTFRFVSAANAAAFAASP
eukprot:gene35706-424_t